MYAPPEVLPSIILRNTAQFADRTLRHTTDDYEKYRDAIDPFIHWPEAAIAHVCQLFAWKYEFLDFVLPNYMAGWWRQFGKAGYRALSLFCADKKKNTPPPPWPDASAEELLQAGVDFGYSYLFQQFLEGDEERYFFETLGLDPSVWNDRRALFAGLRRYAESEPNDYDKELLWIAMRRITNGGIISPSHDHILLDWIEGVSDLPAKDAFAFIRTHTYEIVCAMEIQWINYMTRRSLSPATRNRLSDIITGLYLGNKWDASMMGLNFDEQNLLMLALWEIWKKWAEKKAILWKLSIELLDSALETGGIIWISTMWNVGKAPLDGSKLEQYLVSLTQKLDPVELEKHILALTKLYFKKQWQILVTRHLILPYFKAKTSQKERVNASLFTVIWESGLAREEMTQYVHECTVEEIMHIYILLSGDDKKDFIQCAKNQIAAIFAKVRSWEIFPYAHFVHDILQRGKKAPAFDILMGIGSFCPPTPAARLSNPLLPEKKSWNLVREITRKIGDALRSFGRKSHERALLQAIERGGELRESLLSIFGEGYYPIGGKVHFSEPLSEDKAKLLRQLVGFNSTSFHLLHTNESMNLPPCQSPLQLIAILYQLEKLGIIQDKNLQLQLSVAGQLPNHLATLSGSACIFAKPQAIQYKKEAFLTSHNSETATCIMCYDAGVLDREGFTNLPPQIDGRTDMLGFSQIIEVITYFLVGNMISQSHFGGKFHTIGYKFIDDYMALLREAGLAWIIQKKWVHTPGDKETPAAEEEHYQVVKVCTDILTSDIEKYRVHGRADGFSFQVKKLLHDYIVRYNLLPLDEVWARNYLRYLHYHTLLPAEVADEKLVASE